MDYQELALDEVDLDQLDRFASPLPGKYHGRVVAINLNDPKIGKMVVDIEILAGVPAGQEGRIQRLYYAHEGATPTATAVAIKKKLKLALALVLTTKDEIIQAKERGQRLRIDFALALGRHLLLRVDANERTKTGTSVDWGLWAIDDPEAKGIPINMAALRGTGVVAPSDTTPF
jgi:hypothetical protein